MGKGVSGRSFFPRVNPEPLRFLSRDISIGRFSVPRFRVVVDQMSIISYAFRCLEFYLR